MMYEGFSNYDAFADSIGDGFANNLNVFVPQEEELLSIVDGYSALCAVFGDKLSTKTIRAVTRKQVQELIKELEFGCDLSLTEEQVLDCLRGALHQTSGKPDLDSF